jgi:hypothetical protein
MYDSIERILKVQRHSRQRIITETWIEDPDLSGPLETFIEDIFEFVRSKNLALPDTDLVLYCSVDKEGKNWCGYYFVSHRTRILFWLENFQVDEHLEEVRGELHPTHISGYPHLFD